MIKVNTVKCNYCVILFALLLDVLATTSRGVVIKNTAANKPYKYIEGEERKIEGNTGEHHLINKNSKTIN